MKQQERWTQWNTAVEAAIMARPSAETQRSYRRAWTGWLDHLDGRGPWEATRKDVLAWVKRLRARGLQKNTIALRLMQCHAIWATIQQDEAARQDIFTLVETGLGVDQTLRRTPALSAVQVDLLLNSIKTHCVTGARDFALLGTLLATGARAGEVLGLRVGDVNLQDGQDGQDQMLVTLRGREVPTPASIWDAVQLYLDLAGRWHAKPEHFLWRPLRNDAASRFGHELPDDRAITLTQLNAILRKRLAWAGIPEPELYSANSLRVTFAREWQIVRPGDTEGLRRRLGHKRFSTTERWLVA